MSKLTNEQKEILRNIQDKIKESLSGRKSYETLMVELKVLMNVSESLDSYYELLRDVFADSSSIPELNVEKCKYAKENMSGDCSRYEYHSS